MEDESTRDEGPMSSELAPKTAKAFNVFLTRLYNHERIVGVYHTGCTLCVTADRMIKEFE
jgi:hypothetical protein